MNDIDATLKERGSRYGAFADHAEITYSIKNVFMNSVKWSSLDNTMKEALDMVAHKFGRILNGDPTYIESWRDAVGYLQLVVNHLSTVEGATDGRVVPMVVRDGKLVEDRLVTPEKDNRVYDTQPVQGQLFPDGPVYASNRYNEPRCGSAAAYPEAKEQSIKASPTCVCY